tara:strand:- start:189 stop:779 length:591 start_codon:yes stop_codon:yes gene_type:complete
MKLKISCFIMILFISNNINSQEFNAGIKAGVSTSQVSGDNLAGFHKAGLLIGGYVNRNINQLLSLQLEMIFIQKGSSNTNKNNPIAEIYLDYIEVPLLLIYRQSENIFIESGIHTSALINGYYHDLYGRLENQNQFDNFDLGFIIGMNYKINNKLSLNTRASNSIIPFAEHASGQTYRFNKGKYNTGLSFILQYQF